MVKSIAGSIFSRFSIDVLKFSVDNFALWLMTGDFMMPWVPSSILEAKELLFKNTSITFFITPLLVSSICVYGRKSVGASRRDATLDNGGFYSSSHFSIYLP